ncbi:MAG: rhodanese-like domain-containing protein [Aeromonas sp.]
MNTVQPLSVNTAPALLAQGALLLDMRDAASFAASHAASARHVTPANLGHVLAAANWTTPLIVMCYHGHSSQALAAQLATLGYQQVYNLTGGYSAWRQSHEDAM